MNRLKLLDRAYAKAVLIKPGGKNTLSSKEMEVLVTAIRSVAEKKRRRLGKVIPWLNKQ